jgi:hypothetical protein
MTAQGTRAGLKSSGAADLPLLEAGQAARRSPPGFWRWVQERLKGSATSEERGPEQQKPARSRVATGEESRAQRTEAPPPVQPLIGLGLAPTLDARAVGEEPRPAAPAGPGAGPARPSVAPPRPARLPEAAPDQTTQPPRAASRAVGGDPAPHAGALAKAGPSAVLAASASTLQAVAERAALPDLQVAKARKEPTAPTPPAGQPPSQEASQAPTHAERASGGPEAALAAVEPGTQASGASEPRGVAGPPSLAPATEGPEAQLPDQIVARLEETWQAGRSSVLLHARPPELGDVRIDLSWSEGRLRVQLTCQDPAACQQLAGRLPELVERIEASTQLQAEVDLSQQERRSAGADPDTDSAPRREPGSPPPAEHAEPGPVKRTHATTRAHLTAGRALNLIA